MPLFRNTIEEMLRFLRLFKDEVRILGELDPFPKNKEIAITMVQEPNSGYQRALSGGANTPFGKIFSRY